MWGGAQRTWFHARPATILGLESPLRFSHWRGPGFCDHSLPKSEGNQEESKGAHLKSHRASHDFCGLGTSYTAVCLVEAST